MKIFSAAEVDASLDDLALIDRLETLFRTGCEMPPRHHHTLAAPNGPGSADATLLLMPAWTHGAGGAGARIGVKLVTVFPDNGKRSLPSIYGQYLLLDGTTGAPLALLDGTMLTKRRTAAVSGLASRYLSMPDARSLLMIGTGALAPHLVRVHAKVRPIERVTIWGRDPAKADRLAAELAVSLPEALGRPISVHAAADRRSLVPEADIVSCATLSKAPLVEGDWLRPGQHLDLVGAYTPEMRESDDSAVRRARVHVDTRGGALEEAGDIVLPMASGAIGAEDVVADLFELARGQKAGRSPDDAKDITLFKSVGAALEDLAAANLAAADAPATTPNCL